MLEEKKKIKEQYEQLLAKEGKSYWKQHNWKYRKKLLAHCKKHTAHSAGPQVKGQVLGTDRPVTALAHAEAFHLHSSLRTMKCSGWLIKAPWLGEEQPMLLQSSESLHRRGICLLGVRGSLFVKKGRTESKQRLRAAWTGRWVLWKHQQPRGACNSGERLVQLYAALQVVTGTRAHTRMEDQTPCLSWGHCSF